jgi:Flp pilus assembly protein TadD
MSLRPSGLATASIALLATFLPTAAHAQLDRSTVRGNIVDEAGQPLAGVKIELEFKGESRTKIVKKMTSDKKGSYIYMGLLPGNWTLTYIRDGFRTARLDTYLSGGGVSEMQPVTLKAGAGEAAGAAPPQAPPGAAAAPPTSAAAGPDAGVQLAAFNTAVEALKAGQDAVAEKGFRDVLVALPGLAPAHRNLGLVLSRRGDVAGAEAAYRKAIELQPQAAESYLALAVVLAQAKRSEDAFKLLQDASPGFTQDARFQFALGATAFDLGKSAEAEAAFGKVVELDATNAEPHFYLASLALNRNEVAAAVARLEKYVAVAAPNAPNLAAAQGLLATLKKKAK